VGAFPLLRANFRLLTQTIDLHARARPFEAQGIELRLALLTFLFRSGPFGLEGFSRRVEHQLKRAGSLAQLGIAAGELSLELVDAQLQVCEAASVVESRLALPGQGRTKVAGLGTRLIGSDSQVGKLVECLPLKEIAKRGIFTQRLRVGMHLRQLALCSRQAAAAGMKFLLQAR
jgi:hypothetical protein